MCVIDLARGQDAKTNGSLYSHLDRISFVDKGFIIWPKRELVLAGPTREILSGQDELG